MTTLVREPVEELIQLGRYFGYETKKEHHIFPSEVLNRRSYFGYVDLVWFKKLHPIKRKIPVVGFEIHNIRGGFNTEQAKKNATTLACLSPSLPVIFFQIDPTDARYGDCMRWAWQGYEKVKKIFGSLGTLSDLEYWTWMSDYEAIARVNLPHSKAIVYQNIKTDEFDVCDI